MDNTHDICRHEVRGAIIAAANAWLIAVGIVHEIVASYLMLMFHVYVGT